MAKLTLDAWIADEYRRLLFLTVFLTVSGDMRRDSYAFADLCVRVLHDFAET